MCIFEAAPEAGVDTPASFVHPPPLESRSPIIPSPSMHAASPAFFLGNLVVGMPRKCRADGLGASPGTCGTSQPDCCGLPHRLDRMSMGQMGHVHGTNRTRPRDGCDPKVKVSRQSSLCLLVVSLPTCPTSLTTLLQAHPPIFRECGFHLSISSTTITEILA